MQIKVSVLTILAVSTLFCRVASSQEYVEQYVLSGFTKNAKGETVVHVLYAHTGPQGPKGPPTREFLKVKLPKQQMYDLTKTLDEVNFLSNLAKYFDRDVELVDEQKSVFRNINRQFRQDAAKVIFKFGKGEIKEPELAKGLATANRKVNDAKSKLLPHQSKRLGFLRARMEVDINGLVDALVRGNLGKSLKIEKDQQTEIQKIKRDFENELAKFVQDLRRDARKKIIKELSFEQREKFKSIFGGDEIIESEDYMRKVLKRMLTYFRL